jgi:hypothetical protein
LQGLSQRQKRNGAAGLQLGLQFSFTGCACWSRFWFANVGALEPLPHVPFDKGHDQDDA